MSTWLPAFLLGVMSFASPANTIAQRPQQIGVTFSAPDDCAQVEQFQRSVIARLPALSLEPRPGADVQVDIRRERQEVRAELRILLQGGGQLSRTISAEDCSSAVEAIAFVAAVALDPGAPEPIHLRSSPPEATPPTTDGPAASPAEKGAPAPTSDAASSRRQRRAVSQRRTPRLSDPAGAGTHVEFLIGGRLQTGAAPGPLYGAELGLTWGARWPGLWSPSATLLAGFGVAGGFAQEAGTAIFALAQGDLMACPSRLHLGVLEARPCLQVQLGAHWAEGRDTLEPTTSVRLWSGAGPGVDLALSFSKRGRFYMRAGALFPFVRDEYQFDALLFHRVALATLEAAAGLNLRFE